MQSQEGPEEVCGDRGGEGSVMREKKRKGGERTRDYCTASSQLGVEERRNEWDLVRHSDCKHTELGKKEGKPRTSPSGGERNWGKNLNGKSDGASAVKAQKKAGICQQTTLLSVQCLTSKKKQMGKRTAA